MSATANNLNDLSLDRFATSHSKCSDDCDGIIFIVNNLKWQNIMHRQIRNEPSQNPRKANLIDLLKQRELYGHGSFISKNVHYQKPLDKMSVRQVTKDPQTSRTKVEMAPIDKKGMYLGLSHDSTYLLELSIDGVDSSTMLSFLDCATTTGDEAKFCLIIYAITPKYLYPRYILNLGQRSLLSIFYAGFSRNQYLFISHCFNSIEHKYFTEGTYTDTVYIDVALLKHNVHVSLQIVVNNTCEKQRLTKQSYFRILDDGFIFDTGAEIVAVTFSEELHDSCDSRQSYSIQLKDYGFDEEQPKKLIQGIFLRNMTVNTTITVGCPNDFKSRASESLPIYEIKSIQKNENVSNTNGNSSSDMSSLPQTRKPFIFMTETSLNSERVINAVMRSILTTKFRNHKFMGITASEAYITAVKGHIANILAIGVIEMQSTRYVFSRLAVELDWDLRKPSKMSLINLSLKEVNWLTAMRGDWRPKCLQFQYNMEDRLMTNDVVESLSSLRGSCPGGLIFSL